MSLYEDLPPTKTGTGTLVSDLNKNISLNSSTSSITSNLKRTSSSDSNNIPKSVPLPLISSKDSKIIVSLFLWVFF
jgi:hypothetical protein